MALSPSSRTSRGEVWDESKLQEALKRVDCVIAGMLERSR